MRQLHLEHDRKTESLEVHKVDELLQNISYLVSFVQIITML